MKNLRILLASGSPRRKELLEALDYTVRQINPGYQETIELGLSPEKVPEFLATQKMKAALSYRKDEDAIITADTVVLFENELIHKPENIHAAYLSLKKLSGQVHRVITGVCIRTDVEISFSVETKVWMRKISPEDIAYYVQKYNPTDKAGAYGIQEWIGWSHIDRIEGSFANVMGLPTGEVYRYMSTLFRKTAQTLN